MISGGLFAAVVNGLLAAGLCAGGFTYLDPPPPEKEQILIEFEQAEVKKPQHPFGQRSVAQTRRHEPSDPRLPPTLRISASVPISPRM